MLLDGLVGGRDLRAGGVSNGSGSSVGNGGRRGVGDRGRCGVSDRGRCGVGDRSVSGVGDSGSSGISDSGSSGVVSKRSSYSGIRITAKAISVSVRVGTSVGKDRFSLLTGSSSSNPCAMCTRRSDW